MNRVFGFSNRSPDAVLRERVGGRGFLPRGWIDGCILTNDTTDANNDLLIAPGSCRSTVNIYPSGLPSTANHDQVDIDVDTPILKQLDVNWLPHSPGGDRSGMRSASALANTTWHIFAIWGPGRAPDILAHDSVTQSSVLAALPAGYTAYRRIGSIMRAAGAIRAFSQIGDEFLHTSPIADVNVTIAVTTAVTYALSVPLNIKVQAITNVSYNSANILYISPLDQSDQAASSAGSPGITLSSTTGSFSGGILGRLEMRTNTSGQIRTRSIGTGGALLICTIGWIDSRGRDA